MGVDVSYPQCSGSWVGFRFKGVHRITKIMTERKISKTRAWTNKDSMK